MLKIYIYKLYKNIFIEGKYILPSVIIFMVRFTPRLINKLDSVAHKHFGFLPGNKRLNRTSNPFDDFDVEVSGLPNFDEINIVMRGKSYDEKIYINKTLPTFFVNFYEDHHGFNPSNGVFHITAANKVFNRLSETKLEPVIFIGGKDVASNFYFKYEESEYPYIDLNNHPTLSVSHKSKSQSFQLGSGLMAIVALYKISEKFNIYGWDEYLNVDAGNIGHWDLLFSLIDRPAHYNSNLPLISEKIINWIYASRFNLIENIKIHSFLSNINSHERIIKNLLLTMYFDEK
jgi:hypothetical protein